MTEQTPKWLLADKTAAFGCDCHTLGRRRRGDFWDKTIERLDHLWINAARNDNDSRSASWARNLDARVKLLIFLMLVVTLSFIVNPTPLLLMGAFLAAVTYFARLPIWPVWRRAAVLSLFFAFLPVLPAALNIFTPGPVLISLFKLPATSWLGGRLGLPPALYISRPGVLFLLVFFLRSWEIITAALLLTAVTPVPRLIKAVAALPGAAVLSALLLLTYRYIFTLAALAKNTYMAKKSRTITPLNSRGERFWANGRVAWLWRRSVYLSGQVNQAMLSRGWRGRIKSLKPSPLGRRDYFALFSTMTFIAILLAALGL